MKFAIADKLLSIDGNATRFPLPLSRLEGMLGQPSRHIRKKYNHVYTWDALGICAYSKSGHEVESITLDISAATYDFSPSTAFTSEFTIESLGLAQYLQQHLSKLEKISRHDEGGNLVFGDLEVYVDMSRGQVLSVSMKEHVAPPERTYAATYKFQKIDGEKIEFADFNFKLSIIQILMYEKNILKPKFDLQDFVKNHREREIDIDQEGYDLIPEVSDYFQKLEIDKKHADEVVEILQDGGNRIYGELMRFWDGEDDTFNIKSFEDIRHFSNLKKMALFHSDENEAIKAMLAKRGIQVE